MTLSPSRPMAPRVRFRTPTFDGLPHLCLAASGAVAPGRLLEDAGAVLAEHGADGGVARLAFFVPDEAAARAARAAVEARFGPAAPATSIVLQPPCGGATSALEVLAHPVASAGVRIDRPVPGVVRVEHAGLTWVHVAGVEGRPDAPAVFNQTVTGLSRLRRLLSAAGVGLEDVLRTWFYLGGITDPEGATQRYMELNRARTDFYEGVYFLSHCLPPGRSAFGAYPASTGIGAAGRGLVVEALALQTDRRDVIAAPIENPLQTSAFAYAERYSPKSPKFSRAMALATADEALVLVSGTASIVDSETRHLGDVVAQTSQTLDNIEALIGEANFVHHGLAGRGAGLSDLVSARVYVKRAEDFPAVRSVCEERLGDVPTTFVVADVCRPELLVEIEAVAVARRR